MVSFNIPYYVYIKEKLGLKEIEAIVKKSCYHACSSSFY